MNAVGRTATRRRSFRPVAAGEEWIGV